jgi:hypothetical protein
MSSLATSCFRAVESITFQVGTVMDFLLNLKLWMGTPIYQLLLSGGKVVIDCVKQLTYRVISGK